VLHWVRSSIWLSSTSTPTILACWSTRVSPDFAGGYREFDNSGRLLANIDGIDSITNPDQIAVQCRLTMPPLIVGGLMPDAQKHVLPVMIQALSQFDKYIWQRHIYGDKQILSLCHLEVSDLQLSSGIGELLTDITVAANSVDPLRGG